MLHFSLGLLAGISMGVFIMCLMIMAGNGSRPVEKKQTRHNPDESANPLSS